MKASISVVAVVFALSSSAHAKAPTVPLKCGKSSGAVAERQYLDAASGGGNIYSIFVTYIGKKPSNAKVEAALRECVAEATKLDSSKDMTATAWLKPHAGAADTDDVQLFPFGPMKFMVYTASDKKVVVRGLQKS